MLHQAGLLIRGGGGIYTNLTSTPPMHISVHPSLHVLGCVQTERLEPKNKNLQNRIEEIGRFAPSHWPNIYGEAPRARFLFHFFFVFWEIGD